MNFRSKTSTMALTIAGLIAVEAYIGTAIAQIDEIIVTARKREESLQNVPVAVSAFSGSQLEKAGFEEISDLNQGVPNFYVREEDGYSNSRIVVNLRGQEPASEQTNSDPTVGFYVDGVNMPILLGLQGVFFDLDRIEVLKGPQGTLYGRNTNGGAILVHTRRPDFEGIHGTLGIDAGSYEMLNYRGAINLPIVEDKLAVRLGAQKSFREGFGKSRLTSQPLGGSHDQVFFRGSMIFEPIERLRFFVSGDYLNAREDPAMQTAREYVGSGNADFAISAYGSPCAFGDTACARSFATGVATRRSEDFFRNDSDLYLYSNYNAWGVNGTVEFVLTDDIMLKSITGHRSFWEQHFTDFDGGPFELLTTGHPDFPGLDNHQEAEFFSQEINLTGTSFGDKLEWLLGGYYSDLETNDRDWVTFFRGALPKHFFEYDGAPDTKSVAGFAQLTYALTDTLNFTTGGRWTKEKDSQSTAHVIVVDSLANNGVTPPTWVCRPPVLVTPNPGVVSDPELCRSPMRSVSESGFSWLFGLDWQPNDDLMFYAKHGRGFRGGGFDIRTSDAEPFSPEFAFDIEVGMKADWFDNRLRTNVAAFRTKWSNKQEQTIIPGPSTVTENAAEARLYGVEADITANPIEGLTLGTTVGWLDGKFTKFPNALLENPGAHPDFGTGPYPGFPDQIDAAGEKFRDPTWTLSLLGRYERGICDDFVIAGIQANWYYRGEEHTSRRRNDFAVTQSLLDEFDQSRHNLNMRADFDVPDHGVNLAFFVTNLLDKHYQLFTTEQSSVGGMVRGTTLPPRMWGAKLTYKFGEE